MTGTPLDLTPFGGFLKGIGLFYWIAALACASLALWWFKRWWMKLGAAAAIVVAFITPAVQHVREKQQQYGRSKGKAGRGDGALRDALQERGREDHAHG